MPAAVETMAYAGRFPWHGLGTKVDDCISTEEMLVAAGLDWEIHPHPIEAVIPDPLSPDEHVGIAMDSHRALVRERTVEGAPQRDILGICGPKYVPTQNQEALDFYERFCKAGSMTLETAGALQGGRQVFALAKIKDGFTLPGSDQVEPYLLLSNPHIWGKSLIIMYTPIRVVCMNTLMMALQHGGAQFRAPHIKTFDSTVQEDAIKALALAKHLTGDFAEKAKFLSKKKCTDEDAVVYAAHLFDKANADRIESGEKVVANELNRAAWQVRTNFSRSPGAELKSAKGTWWGALNAATYYVDHEAGRDRDTALTSAWFGQRAAVKRRALDLALELAA